MIEPLKEDAELIQNIARADRARRWMIVGMGAAVGALTAIWMIVLDWSKGRISPTLTVLAIAILVIAVAALIVGAGLLARRVKPNFEDLDNPFTAGYGERLQHQRRRFFFLVPLFMSGSLPSAIMASAHISSGHSRGALDVLPIMGFLCTGGAVVMTLSGWGYKPRLRELIDDELSVSIRRRSLQAGFLALMGATATLYLASLVWPSLAMQGLPVVLFIGMAVPAVWFARLERRAERDG